MKKIIFHMMNKKNLFAICLLIPNPKLGDLFDFSTCVVSKSILPVLFALAIVVFIWGVVQYVINSEEEAKKAAGRQFMIWGLISITVIVSIWGLVNIVTNTFNIQNAAPAAQSP